MKQNKLFLGLATLFAVAFTFTACSSDDAESQSALQDRTIRLTSSVERGSTRATSDPQSGTSLSTSSSLGVFAINNSTALTNGINEKYSVDGSGNLTPTTVANTMTWPESGTVSFYAYAPWIDGATYDGTNAFSVQTDQTGVGYLASDLVLAKNENVAETSSAVQLSFNHLMAKINITIQKAANATVDLTHAKVSIINTNTATTFKPNAAGTNEDKVLGTASTPADITLFEGDGSTEPTTVVGIMVPQDIAAGSGLVKIQTYPGNAANRTLIAKIDEAKKFESGQQYSFTVTINDPEAPVTYITLKAGSTELVAWNDNNLGASTMEYSKGDYILNDGSIVRASTATSEQKNNVVAIIFSNKVSDVDAEAGYDGYAMSFSKISDKKWLYASVDNYSHIPSSFAASLEDLDGRSQTNSIRSAWQNDANYSSAFVNTESAPIINVNAVVGYEGDGKKNLSGWFVPSFGQMAQILNALGDAGIESTLEGVDWNKTGSGEIYSSTDNDCLSTINNLLTSGLGKSAIFSSGDVYITTTEATTANFQYIKVIDNNQFALGRSAGKTGTNNRRVLPCLAFKIPTE